jgi:D-alanyl-D-alanine carboxypeptidase
MRHSAIQRICFSIVIVLVTAIIAVPFYAEAASNPRYSGLVLDADSGTVLYQDRAGELRYPASLTKIMTAYLTFEALQRGKLSLDQRVYVSAHAASMPSSKLGLKKGERISVRDALLSIIVKSANDSAVVLAEAIGGSEWQFAQMMTEKAHQLGMKNTTFRNASGLHHPAQKTTAYDMARLAVALYNDHRKYYHLFSRTKFSFKGQTVTGHNRLLTSYRGADGLKTGYIRLSGYNLVTSVERNGDRVVGVVFGGRTSRSRDAHMKDILNQGYRKLASLKKDGKRFADTPTPELKGIKVKGSADTSEDFIPSPTKKPSPIFEADVSSRNYNMVVEGDNAG